jgi:hypothetical protein
MRLKDNYNWVKVEMEINEMWSRFPRFDVPYNLPVAVVLISFFRVGGVSVFLCSMREPWLCEMNEAKEIEGDRVMILTESDRR